MGAQAARLTVRAALSRGGGWQPFPRVAEILARYGITMVSTITAVGDRAVLNAARRAGYPIVLKAADPRVADRRRIGGVCLDLPDPSQVEAAYRRIEAALGSMEPAVLVQPMMRGTEWAARVEPGHGRARHRRLEVRVVSPEPSQAVIRSLPVRGAQARRMWAEAGVDDDAAVALLDRINQLAVDLPEVTRLDLASIQARHFHGDDDVGGLVVVDAKLFLEPVR